MKAHALSRSRAERFETAPACSIAIAGIACFAWTALLAAGTTPSFSGDWTGDDHLVEGHRLTFFEGHMRYGDCEFLLYRSIEQYASDEHNDYFAMDVQATEGVCRPQGSESLILAIRVSKHTLRRLHVHTCPTYRDLDLFKKRDSHNNCSGEFHYQYSPTEND